MGVFATAKPVCGHVVLCPVHQVKTLQHSAYWAVFKLTVWCTDTSLRLLNLSVRGIWQNPVYWVISHNAYARAPGILVHV